jgi:hypothetical protein
MIEVSYSDSMEPEIGLKVIVSSANVEKASATRNVEDVRAPAAEFNIAPLGRLRSVADARFRARRDDDLSIRW